MTFIESVYNCVYHENVMQIMFIFQETERVVSTGPKPGFWGVMG